MIEGNPDLRDPPNHCSDLRLYPFQNASVRPTDKAQRKDRP